MDHYFFFGSFIPLSPQTTRTQVFLLPLEPILSNLWLISSPLLDLQKLEYSKFSFLLNLYIHSFGEASLISLNNKNMLPNTKFIFPAQTPLPKSKFLYPTYCVTFLHGCLIDIWNLRCLKLKFWSFPQMRPMFIHPSLN